MMIQGNHKLFDQSAADFDAQALGIFQHQYLKNKVYKQYVDLLGISPARVLTLDQIPFLPIRFFKSEKVVTGPFEEELVFESSGTTGSINSRHYIKDARLYEESFTRGFEIAYGNPRDYCIIGLLPSYLERQHSSLVYMVKKLIELSGHPDSGFYLDDHEKLFRTLSRLEDKGTRCLLIGVSFALLDFAEQYSLSLDHTVIMETGGMKGRRKEMIRMELHDKLKKAFRVETIHSEYGMTELLSQAYSKGKGIFKCPPWMRVCLRDEEDPLSIIAQPQQSKPSTGIINIIDLANIHSCSFIATDDIGRLYPDGSFEVLGRMDNSDLRGCSLLIV